MMRAADVPSEATGIHCARLWHDGGLAPGGPCATVGAQTRLVRVSLEVQAETIASKITQFIGQIEAQLSSWSPRPIDQGRFNALKLMRETSAISELYLIDGAGKEQFRVSRVSIE